MFPPTEPAGHEARLDELLLRIEDQGRVSQRSLAQELGIALGLTNLLLRRLAQLGWIQVERLNRNHARYLITPLGLAQRARVKQQKLEQAIRSYADARDRVRASLERLSAEWPEPGARQKRVVFFGANELTEIASVCLKGMDLQLVAVVDDAPLSKLVEVPIIKTTALTASAADGRPFDRLVMMTMQSRDRVTPRLIEIGFPLENVAWI